MAKKGRVSLFGTGEYRINPIHGEDLTEVCVRAIEDPTGEIEVGGPDQRALTPLSIPVRV